jgi:hypothetical protein
MAAFDPLVTPVDVVKLGRRGSALQDTPGLAQIYDADQKLAWDPQQSFGATGAVLIFHGAKLVEFYVVLRLWLSEHWQAWDTFRPLVQRAPFGKVPLPLTISHPWLTMQGVQQCVVTACGMPSIDEYMLGTIKISFIEYRQVKRALAKPQSEPVAPLDPVDQHIKANVKRADQDNAIVAQAQLTAK